MENQNESCYKQVGGFVEGFATVEMPGRTWMQSKWGHVDAGGKLLYEPCYQSVGEFINGYAVVADFECQFSHIDTSGKQVYSQRYSWAYNFSKEGFAEVLGSKGWGHIDTSGNELYEPCYESVCPFENGFAVVNTKDGKRGIINTKGEFLSE